MKKIFIVEDDAGVSDLLEFNLKKQGYQTAVAADGFQALGRLEEEKPDLILLDIMLPGLDGYEVCRIIRSRSGFKLVPIIMVTVKSEEPDVVHGLEVGADDYVTKPFNMRELLSRIKVHLRRNEELPNNRLQLERNKDSILKIGDITLKLAEYKVYVRDKPINLTQKECELLKYLMSSTGRILKRDYLMEKIWGYGKAVDTRTVDIHIRHLRQKIENDPGNPRYIKTLRGVGYYWANPHPAQVGDGS
jgi:two-component system alkaline phosphatase synthesis response regulator PhoP